MVVVAAVAPMSGTVIAEADTASDLDAAKARLDSIRERIEQEEADLAVIQAQMNDLAARIEVAETQVASIREHIATTRDEIAQMQTRYGRLQDRLGERAADAFMQGGAGAGLDLVLGATTLNDLADRLAFVDAVTRADAELANQANNAGIQLTFVESELQRQLADQEATLAGLQRDRTDLEAKFADQEQRIGDVTALRSEAADLISRLEDQLQRELAPPPAPPASGGGGDGIPGPLYACPVDGPHAYADTFGQIHVHPGWRHIHEGNDIIAPYGTPIVAPFAGVATPGSDDTAGTYVTVTGSEGFVQMLHMSELGATGRVRTGEVVGYVGTTGNAESPHTHFEWHPGGGPAADPYPLLNEVC